MQDRAVVAAIVADEPDGVAAAYDQYGAFLYACCHSLLPGPEAAAAVRDTFMIAAGRLDGLRDPDRLGDWLRAVARNECLRVLGPAAAEAAALVPGAADLDDEPPAVTLPVELRGQVLTACADNSPGGRAQRMSVAHRAGAFGRAGFPKAAGLTGPRWWQQVRRHPRAVAATVVVTALAMVAGTTVIMAAGGPHRPRAARARYRRRHTRSRPRPARPRQPRRCLRAHPALAPGKPASGFFIITTANGPVNQYTVKVPAAVAGMVMVSPSKGSLPANGYVEVIVTVTGTAALTAHLTVEPGNLTVTVVLKIKED